MNCRKVQNLISTYVDCELSGLEMLAVRQHLHDCSECNAEFERTLRLKRALGALATKQPSAQFAAHIIRHLDYAPRPAHVQVWMSLRQHMGMRHGRLGLAAAAAGVAAFLFIAQPGGVQQPDSYASRSLGALQIGTMIEEPAVDMPPPATPRVAPVGIYATQSRPSDEFEIYRGSERPDFATNHVSLLLTNSQ